MEPTVDSMMADFVCDMVIADDELSDSIFTCVDNFIDNLCLKVMDDENSIFDAENEGEGDLPFNYIIDKVLEKIDTIESISDEEPSADESQFCNSMDPDYCPEVNFDEISPEDFQLYIPKTCMDDESDEVRAWSGSEYGTATDPRYDSIFNA